MPVETTSTTHPGAASAAQRRASWEAVDPIVLAASIGSGPNVTRHHFHHSYDNAGPGDASALAPFLFPPGAHADLCDNADGSSAAGGVGAGAGAGAAPADAAAACGACADNGEHYHPPTPFSGQMARSERLKLIKQQQQRILAHRRAHQHDAGTSSSHTHARRSSKTQNQPQSQSQGQAAKALDSTLQDMLTPSPAVPGAAHEPTPPLWEGSVYESQQMPRQERLRREAELREAREAAAAQRTQEEQERKLAALMASRQADQAAAMASVALVPSSAAASAEEALSANPAALRGKPFIKTRPPVSVRCHARTRVPTPHGECFVHIYRNNHDDKEHLALVVDPAQNDTDAMAALAQNPDVAKPPGYIRSRSLEEKWSMDETPLDRIVRGAYVGRLGPEYQQASAPGAAEATAHASAQVAKEEMAPLVRIHSECYTGETIGSQRCDCGEQLDEAIRLISRTGRDYADGRARGVVVYMRQEGRGIGLLDKIMAYNLQDMGADTVAANILLGHLPDARQYDIASAILRDLGINQCRLLTNNPEKMEALEEVGVQVAQRVAMVPRMWRQRTHRHNHNHHRHGRRRTPSHMSRTTSTSASPARTPGTPGTPSKARPHGPSRLHESYLLDESSAAPSSTGESGTSSGDRDLEHEHQEDGEDEIDEDADECAESDSSEDSYLEYALRRGGLTMMGGSVTRGPELEKYLRTKVERMGHMLELPPEQQAAQAMSRTSTSSRSHAHRAKRTEAHKAPAPPRAATGAVEQSELAGVFEHSERAVSMMRDHGELNSSLLLAHVAAVRGAHDTQDATLLRASLLDVVGECSDLLAQETTPLPPALTAALGHTILTCNRVVHPRA